MKKNLNYLLSALGLSAAAIFTLSGCRDYDVMDEEKAKDVSKFQEYVDNFVKEFGQADPNHTWGFGVNVDFNDPVQIAELEKYANAWKQSGTTTRAKVNDSDHSGSKAASVSDNVNQWTEDNDFALSKRVHIPGYPNDDKINYTQNNYLDPAHKAATGNAAGDVTDYEIWYVSKWFRENKAGTAEFESRKVALHLSDFFIQNVSRDNDRNADGSFIERWEDAGQNMNYEMNQLKFKDLDGAWSHINDFNNSDNKIPLNGGTSDNPTQQGSKRLIKYVMSSGTEDFIYHPSLDQNSAYYNKWVLIKLDWNETMADGQLHHRVGYYLAFDYECEYTNNRILYTYPGDDYYSNWILKITPGHFKQGARWPKRFMCEDLGNTYDFDFNDAVFDLTFVANADNSNKYDAVLTIQAAGGTLPIMVGRNNRDYEIHKLLGNETLSPINIGPGTPSSEVAIYRVKEVFTNNYSFYEPGNADWVKPDGYEDNLLNLWGQMALGAFTLKIYIDQNNDGVYESEVSGWDVLKNLHDNYKVDEHNTEIKGEVNAPQLFNCSTKAYWMQESQAISKAYDYFSEWVDNEICAHRLEWDKDVYYKRTPDGKTEKVNPTIQYQGAWDQIVKESGKTLVWPKYGTMINVE